MSTPDPAAPPPAKSNAKKWLVGCLVALVLAVLICLAALLLLAYAAKRQVDAMAPEAKRVYEDARRAAAALESTTPVAAGIAQSAEARMRLGRAASAVLAFRVADSEPAPSPRPSTTKFKPRTICVEAILSPPPNQPPLVLMLVFGMILTFVLTPE